MAIAIARDFPMFIDGRSTESSDGTWLEVHDPATTELVGRVPAGTSADVDRAVAAARASFRDGSRVLGQAAAVRRDSSAQAANFVWSRRPSDAESA